MRVQREADFSALRVSARFMIPVIVVVVCALVYMVSVPTQNRARELYEMVRLFFDQSGELAYAYGDEHFNANNPSAYDIDFAEHCFRIAVQRDPQVPYVFHELARVEFLKGDLGAALALIDVQILNQGDRSPSSYYVRGLIEGYMGNYAEAVNDYKHFVALAPDNWAGLNDYAWVLLKDDKPQEAISVTAQGLQHYPNNPWLLNSNATALYETGDIADARSVAERAEIAVQKLTPNEWSAAYPGNDPDIAPEGVATFQKAVADNIRTILAATTTSVSR